MLIRIIFVPVDLVIISDFFLDTIISLMLISPQRDVIHHKTCVNFRYSDDVDGTDEVSMTKAYLWGQKSLLEYERYYKEYLRISQRI